MRNVELKARLRDRFSAEAVCARIDASFQGIIRQRDTYFPVRTGRLKFRESDPGEDYWVYYHRADVADAKTCEYRIKPADRRLRPFFEDALGSLAVVEKTRHLWLWENVRIHLDEVKGLGNFLEFEAVLLENYDEADGRSKVAWLRDEFGINTADVVDGSYLDLSIRA